MKKARIINAAIWAAIAIAITVYVCYQWSVQGAPTKSLILGAVFHMLFPALMCALVDDKIRRAAE